MSRTPWRIGAVVAALVIAGSSGEGFAADVFTVGTSGFVYTLNTATFSVTPLFLTNTPWYDAANGDDSTSFYGTPNGGSLYRIDVAHLTANPVGSYGGAGINGLARDSATGILYGTDYVSLYTISKVTGAATVVGSLNGPVNVWAMDYDPVLGKLIGFNSDNGGLYTINEATGAASLVGLTGQTRMTDLWYDTANGRMLGVGNSPGRFFLVNDSTGAATVLYNYSTDPGLLGLGAPTPEPATLSLLALGGLALLRRRKKARKHTQRK